MFVQMQQQFLDGAGAEIKRELIAQTEMDDLTQPGESYGDALKRWADKVAFRHPLPKAKGAGRVLWLFVHEDSPKFFKMEVPK